MGDLSVFAKENLKPMCSPARIEHCDDEKKSEIQKIMGMSDDELNVAIVDAEKKVNDIEDKFKKEVKKLQDSYQDRMKDRDNIVSTVKNAGLGLMKSVRK